MIGYPTASAIDNNMLTRSSQAAPDTLKQKLLVSLVISMWPVICPTPNFAHALTILIVFAQSLEVLQVSRKVAFRRHCCSQFEFGSGWPSYRHTPFPITRACVTPGYPNTLYLSKYKGLRHSNGAKTEVWGSIWARIGDKREKLGKTCEKKTDWALRYG